MSHKDNRVSMPSSGAGLTKYFDDYGSKIQLNPKILILLILLLIITIMGLSGTITLLIWILSSVVLVFIIILTILLKL